MIPQEIAEKIKLVSKLEDVIDDLHQAGRQQFTTCPKCGKIDVKKKKGLMFNPSKQIAKCFSCDFSVTSAASYLMEVRGMKYPEALAHLAGIHHIEIETDEDRQARLSNDREARKEKKTFTFCDRQLRHSGLTSEDVEIEFEKDNATHRRPAFMSGTRDQYGVVV